MEEKRRLNPIIPILSVLLAAAIGLCIFLWMGKSKAEKLAEEYKTSYDNLVEENEKAKKAEEEAKKEAAKVAKQYQEDYNALVADMLDDAVLAENLGNLIINVWNNAIFSKADEETDKYTKQNGKFVSDFNDALSNLWNDKELNEQVSALSDNQKDIKDRMKNMLNPPEGFESAFSALEAMYNSYISFTNIVLRCDGSLNSFSEDFSSADESLSQLFTAAELYVK
ncbi:MAG: hypothetical protein K5679_02160 [Lachnospiraceae bacterium]|nr:hypothetical protein [Lachnospiraceae bacterium]